MKRNEIDNLGFNACLLLPAPINSPFNLGVISDFLFLLFFFNSFVIAILVIRKGPTFLLHEFDKKEVTGRFF
jgi:hypothetical protein